MARPSVRPRILSAAAELLQKHGAAALTTRGVAEYAGVTEASVFNNFGSKRSLLHAVVAEALPETRSLAEAIAAEPKELEEWGAEVFVRACDFFQAILPLTGSELAHAPVGRAAKDNAVFPAYQWLTLRWQVLVQAQRFRMSCDSEVAALMLLGTAMHTALTHLAQGQSAVADERRSLGRRVMAQLGGTA